MRKTILGLAAVFGGGWLLRRMTRQPVVDLQDHVVLITGAAAGIGRAAAHAFAAQGASLVLVDRDADALPALQNELDVYDVSTMIVPADVTDDDALAGLVESVLDSFDGLDVLISNAGLAAGGLHQDVDPARLRQIISTNVYGGLRLAQLVLPHMIARGHGHIVFTTSVAAIIPSPGFAAYGATKAALLAGADALRREVTDSGIRVSAVLPGTTNTALIGHDPARYARPGAPVDEPEVPAQALIDVVRYGLRQVTLGGPLIGVLHWLDRLAPPLVDRVWHAMFTPEFIDGMARMGLPAERITKR